MKLQLRFLFVVIAISGLMFSCSNSESTGKQTTPEKISVRVAIQNLAQQEAGDQSRAVSPSVADQTSVTFTSGNLFFVSTDGQIMKHLTISSAASSATNISLADITNGHTIDNVPGNVNVMHVVGNVPNLPKAGSFDNVKQTLVNISQQGVFADVSLYGSGSILPVSGTTYEADASVAAIASRIEISNIVGSGIITGFTVDGIFINNYFSKATVDGTIDVANLVNNGSTVNNYVGGNSLYPAGLPLFDYSATGIGSTDGLTVWPDADAEHKNVWGYQVYPSTTIPHIVIRLSDIETNDGSTFPSPQFLTITGFKLGGTPLTKFEPGKVYNLAAGTLTFNEDNLTPEPELSNISVEVQISLIPWSKQAVTPEL